MPDILTRAETLGRCDKRQYEHCGPHPQYGEIGQRLPPFACVNWKPIPTPESPQNAEKDSDYGQGASEGSQRNLTQSEAVPETIHISLSALRAILLGVFDDGDWDGSPWATDDPHTNNANEQRLRFADELERRLRQLPARG